MDNILSIFCLCIFLITPPLLLGLKLLGQKKIPWWLALLIISLVGWLSVNAAVYFGFEYLAKLLTESPHNSVLAEKAQDDGAAQVFALLFGWLYALIYSIPWLIIFVLVRRLHKPKEFAAP
jgi:hypothetical protein